MGNGIVKHIRHLGQCLLEVIYNSSNSCVICKEELVEGYLCDRCKKDIRFCDGEFFIEFEGQKIRCKSVTYYSGIVKDMILRLKYRSDFESGEVLAEFMSSLLQREIENFDFITYVPISLGRLKKRGYNQTKFLAKHIQLNSEYKVIDTLEKKVNSKDQIGLTNKERLENMRDSFKVKDNKVNKIKDKKILLIDDVLTTGATTFYCAKALLDSGANEVRVLTIAKSKI